MLERDMYPLFAAWLEDNVDIYTDQLMLPATACFDFIAIKGGDVIVYELKLRDAKKVIQQANIAHLWCDHSYVVMPKKYVHLAMKNRHYLKPCSGIMSLDMKDGSVQIEHEPTKSHSHLTIFGLRQAMRDRIIEDVIVTHQAFIAKWKNDSIVARMRIEKKGGRVYRNARRHRLGLEKIGERS